MTPEDQEQMIAQHVLIAAEKNIAQAHGINFTHEDFQAKTIAVLWTALEQAAGGMSKDALKRLIFGEDHIVDANKMVAPQQPAPQPPTQQQDAWLNDAARRSSTLVANGRLVEQPAPQPVASCRHQWTDESPANSWRSSCRLCGAQQAGSGQ